MEPGLRPAVPALYVKTDFAGANNFIKPELPSWDRTLLLDSRAGYMVGEAQCKKKIQEPSFKKSKRSVCSQHTDETVKNEEKKKKEKEKEEKEKVWEEE